MLNTTLYNPDVLTCLANLSSDEVFTPPKLVNEILDLLPETIWQDKNATFLDPCCKSGVFLREIARRLLVGLKDEIPDLQARADHIFKKQLFGIAITELTAHLSRRSVYCSKHANGRYSVSSAFSDEQGNIRFERVAHTWRSGRCVYCGASQELYDREAGLETHAYQFIHKALPEDFKNMKFDVIIGNPPYQMSDGGGSGTSAIPLYNKFVSKAMKLNPRFISMIIPSRWFSGGKGLNKFRNLMLNDDRIRIIHDFPEATDIFPGVQIKGGICYFLWERDNRGLCSVYSHAGSKITGGEPRPLLEEGSDTFIRYNEAIEILRKVKITKPKSFEQLVSTRRQFAIDSNFQESLNTINDPVKVFTSEGEKIISRSEIKKNIDWIDSLKVFISKAGSGSDSFPHQILGKPFLGNMNTASTETFLLIGPFRTENECKNVMSYIATKFFRFLVLLKKNTQNAPKGVYSFVPLQDFSKPWTDEELYEKYNLTEDEITFIESMIRPMVLDNGDENA